MNITETAAVVAAANQLDPRVELTDDTVRAWHRIIGSLDAAACARAVDVHYGSTDARLMPSHIRHLVNGGPDAGRLARRAFICSHCSGVHGDEPCDVLIPMPDWVRPTVRKFAERTRQRAAEIADYQTPKQANLLEEQQS